MDKQVASEFVVKAGLELVRTGLIARTWGNVSCRIDDRFFAITPSGRAYENLTTKEIVTCKIEDTTYEGDIKPSSEKGIHALIYKTYPEINFVIHTHQPMASAISAIGIKKLPCYGFSTLGEEVPIAEYGLPGTKKLIKNVNNALLDSKSNAVMLANHGALCFGRNYEEAFSAAHQLEEACLAFIKKLYEGKAGEIDFNLDKLYKLYALEDRKNEKLSVGEASPIYGSRRTSEGFILEMDREVKYNFKDNLTGIPLIHKKIYTSRSDVNYIYQDRESIVFSAALAGIPLKPYLDDFAQIVGYSVGISKDLNPNGIEKALRGRSGVLIQGAGALYCAKEKADLNAVRLVVQKNALAQIVSRLHGSGRILSKFDCYLMHLVYSKSYSKKSYK